MTKEMHNQKRESVLNDRDLETRTMALPIGKRCGDCYSFMKCNRLIGIHVDNEVCDFHPNRYQDAKGK